MRVSTDRQDLSRQQRLVKEARDAGYYIGGTYAEKASGVNTQRPELQRLLDDLQPGDVVIAERMDRISRLPLEEAKKLIGAIRAKGARVAVPGVVDLSDMAGNADGTAKIVFEAMQDMLLNIALQSANDDYETRRRRQREGIERAKAEGRYKGRKPDLARHAQIIEYRKRGTSARDTAELVGCSLSLVKKVWSKYKAAKRQDQCHTDVE